jgi:hypothetical protein
MELAELRIHLPRIRFEASSLDFTDPAGTQAVDFSNPQSFNRYALWRRIQLGYNLRVKARSILESGKTMTPELP